MSPESEVAVLLQPRGLLHRFIRHRDLSSIVERPERLRAVAIGIAAARAALEVQRDRADPALGVTDGLVDAILKLRIDGIESTGGIAFHILSANFSSNSLASAAVRFIHGEPSEYLSKVLSWALNSEDVIRRGESEIPKGFSQGDLYLCPQSIDALSGAVSAVFQAVDMVLGSKVTNKVGTGSSAEGCTIPVSSTSSAHDSPSADNAVLETAHPSLDEPQQVPLPPSPTGTSAVGYSNVKRVFVCIRPPGHHCSDDTPSGFCFINNILIAASHAHIRYGIKRAVILDIDLHHGNGTQAIAWSINAETAREEESNVLTEEGRDLPGTGLKVFYGSLHDILSFPCEDGEPKATQAASTILRGAHGQYIENVHLESYTDEADFFLRLYPSYLNTLLGGAREFLEATQATSEDTMVYISAGFDASLHEHPYMSRHNRNVPTAFYSRFAVDVRAFAEECCNGRIVAVLEGGYSDRALISGSGAFMQGLAVDSAQQLATDWWNVDRLSQLEKLTKPTHRSSKVRYSRGASGADEAWLSRTQELIGGMDSLVFSPLPPLPNLRPQPTVPQSTMTLRERKKPISATPTPTFLHRPPLSNKQRGPTTTSNKPVSPEQRRVFASSSQPDPSSTTPEPDSGTPMNYPESLKIRIKLPSKPKLSGSVDTSAYSDN